MDQMSSVVMPWGGDPIPGVEFEARLEKVETCDNSYLRVHGAPTVALRTPYHISRSSHDCFYVVHLLAGNFTVRQAGRETEVRPGDVVTYDSSEVTRIDHHPGKVRSFTCLVVPKSAFANVRNAQDHFTNRVIEREKLFPALSECLNHLASPRFGTSREETSALFDACVSLLPVAAGCYRQDGDGLEVLPARSMFDELRAYIIGNLHDPDLSPPVVAERFGISDRYVHKCFAQRGTTFGAYVMQQRLELIFRELVSSEDGRPIAELAFAFGFRDLSTFNRAFKRHFGCTPKQIQWRRPKLVIRDRERS